MNDGYLDGGAELKVDGQVAIQGEFYWQDGMIIGTGTVEIEPGAELIAVSGTALSLRTDLKNQGLLLLESNSSLQIYQSTVENGSGALLDIESDVTILLATAGAIINSGTVSRSGGTGDSWVSGSTESFVSTGRLQIESGRLNLYSGTIQGVVDIGAGAVFQQSGITNISPYMSNQGEGTFEITGRVVLGENNNDVITINNLIFDSVFGDAISGPGDLHINDSFIWRKGEISGLGDVYTFPNSVTILEGSGMKSIHERRLWIGGALETGSMLDLSLGSGAELLIDGNSDWIHTGSGTIRRSYGGTSDVVIEKNFRKKGNGALTVETDLTCSGTMFLEEGELAVRGAFNFAETGTIIGGGTDTENDFYNRRLNFISASSVTLAGTIEVDADGAPAYFGIRGSVSIQPTFKVLIDVSNTGSIPAERLTFETGGVELGGTLEVNVQTFPPEGVQYRVVSTLDGIGRFDSITGADVFYSIIEDERGVLLSRQN
jgi:hypothetical protein